MYGKVMSGALAQAGVVHHSAYEPLLLTAPALRCSSLWNKTVEGLGQRTPAGKVTSSMFQLHQTVRVYVEFLDQAWHARGDWMKPMTFLPKGGKPKNVCISLSCLRFHTGRLLDITGECGIFPCPWRSFFGNRMPKIDSKPQVPWYCEWSGRSGGVFYSDPWLEHFFPGLNCLCGHPRFKFRFNIWWINH